MSGVNEVTILGNLGGNPETRSLPNGDLVTSMSVATSRTWKVKETGETKELVEWHRIVLYRRLAEIAQQYLHKGSKVYVKGYLRTQKWTDDNGIERWTTQIIAENLQLLDSKPKAESKSKAQPPVDEVVAEMDDDFPPF